MNRSVDNFAPSRMTARPPHGPGSSPAWCSIPRGRAADADRWVCGRTARTGPPSRHHDLMPQHPGDNVLEFPDIDHRDADLTFGGCGHPGCPTGDAPGQE